jgi:hypothetical protein
VLGLGVEAAPGHLPTAAWAELALTLVPNQTPEGVVAMLSEHLRAHELDDVAVEVLTTYGGVETAASAPLVETARLVVEEQTGLVPLLRPYAEQPAPLAHVAAGAPLAVVGLGTGRAPWPTLEERVEAQARCLAALLLRLPSLAVTSEQ